MTDSNSHRSTDTYKRVCLTVIAILLAVVAAGVWSNNVSTVKTAQAEAQSPHVCSPAATAPSMDTTEARLREIVHLLKSGDVEVKVTLPDKAQSLQKRNARESMMRSGLMTVRSQIELYKIQHMDNYPGMQGLHIIDRDDLVKDLTTMTNARGNQNASLGTVDYGPYLQGFPANPFCENQSIARQVKVGKGPCPGDGTTGWYVSTTTGRFSANDTKKNPQGKAHKDY